jgi:hypothetical protein
MIRARIALAAMVCLVAACAIASQALAVTTP